ncbi:MAG TPA: protoporphyrinogen oxidase [Egicoccus sp.]|nr:protoporphyrinogen oxidase [Egicoccus sp.]HSK23995.1 protoporphyrinogen oxidase [Egicoccus sp.]
MTGSTTPRVVVVGGGIAGIGAARRLAGSGVAVILLEASDRLGGCVRTVPFAGRRVDVGAEGLHAAAPEPLELARELGLGSQLVPARRAATWIATGRGLRALPDGVGPAGPTRIAPLLRARLLSPTGLARAALEPLVPRARSTGDVAVSTALGRRFGTQVVDRVVEPLLGGLHAGDLERLSLHSATPQLAALLERHRSVVLATRARTAGGAGLVTLDGGLATLFEAFATEFPGTILLDTAATTLVRTTGAAHRYRVYTADGADHAADAVVLATPVVPAAHLLAGLDPGLPALLQPLRAATLGIVLLAYPAAVGALPALAGTGLLVPARARRPLKSATFLTTKWPHLAIDDRVLIRASVGRIDDDRVARLGDAALVTTVRRELADLVGIRDEPTDVAVARWPERMPQLEVGHRRRLDDLRDLLATHPGVVVAGAAFDGVGIAAALRSGNVAAEQVLATLRMDAA